MPTFTSGNDTYTVSAAGDYDLDMLGGDDRLNVYGGTTVTAHLGDGNDYAVLKAALTTIFGDAGADRFDIYAASATVDGGADDDMVNVRGGTGLTASGGLGDDRFNFIVDTSSISIDGGEGNDAFVGYYHSITGNIMGGAGNDSFVQFIGGVTLFGGLGNDTYQIGVSSHAAIFENPNEGNDTVQVARGYSYTLQENFENLVVASLAGSTLGPATLNGNELANYITAGNNDDTISGLDGNDHLFGKGGNDTIDGGNGNDLVDGGGGNDTLIGGAGNDTLVGRTGDDSMSGGAGNDIYYVDSLADVVTETLGEGTDTVRVAVNDYILAANVEIGVIQSGSPAVKLTGNTGDNTLIGSSGADRLYGSGGNDILKGGAGDDELYGDAGNDVLNGGPGADTMHDTGGGDDTYYVDSFSDEVVDLGGNNDTVHVSISGYQLNTVYGPQSLNSGIENGIIDLATGATLGGDDLNNILTGGVGNDSLVGQGGDDKLWGGGGDDQLFGGDGNDSLHGEDGSDELYGGSGNDTYFIDATDHVYEGSGGGTFDAVILSGGGTWVVPDNVESAELDDPGTLTGNDQGDLLFGSDGSDVLIGGAGNDVLYGDTIWGSGNDVVNGGAGDDDLIGGTGNDTLSGGDGSDVLLPGWGADTLTGGAGADIFRFDDYDSYSGAIDAINDFVSGTGSEDDTLDLQFIDANESLSGDQSYTWIGIASFSGAAGQLRVVYGKDGAQCHLYGDTDGDGVADFELALHLTGNGLNLDDIVL